MVCRSYSGGLLLCAGHSFDHLRLDLFQYVALDLCDYSGRKYAR